MARDWLATWNNPFLHQHPTQLVYEPMIELLAVLRSKGFEEFLCSGDTIEFLRAFAPSSYGVAEDHVSGTALLTEVTQDIARPALVLAPAIVGPYNSQDGKPINLQRLASRLPIFVAANEDSDLPLLEVSTAAGGPRFAMLIHHDDAEREFAYDRGAERALSEARLRGWTVVSMKRDWATVFARSPRERSMGAPSK
jgi:hypothetical protein